MKKLEDLILHRLDEESLFLLGERYPSLNVDRELCRRLLKKDKEIYIPVLDLLLDTKMKKSYNIRMALKCMEFCWKIGVIYDFVTGQVKLIEIRIGDNFGKYKLDGKNMIFLWLDVNENKKMLREITSDNCPKNIFSQSLNKQMSEKVRQLILNNKFLTVEVSISNSLNRSFEDSHPLREKYVVHPFSISNEKENIQLLDNGKNLIRYENIPVRKSPEVEKYLQVLSY